jgi:hypothetical protein
MEVYSDSKDNCDGTELSILNAHFRIPEENVL